MTPFLAHSRCFLLVIVYPSLSTSNYSRKEAFTFLLQGATEVLHRRQHVVFILASAAVALKATELYRILLTTRFLDFVHRPEFHKQENKTFQKLDLFPSSGGGGTYSTENLKKKKKKELTLPQAMSRHKRYNHTKQGNNKHMTAG
jgi:hypothetical protein